MCGMDCDFASNLNLCKLCARKAKIDCLCSESFISDKACINQLSAVELKADNGSVNQLCVSRDLSASNIQALDLNANNLCAQDGRVNNLCVNNLTVGVLNHCEKWRAAVVLSADTVYSLGSDINWDLIKDDPNANVSLAPFFYTVPVSGYYSLSFYLNCDSLSGGGVIVGSPVGLLTLSVNGSDLRQVQVPYLTFANQQRGLASALVLLNAGESITMKYEVLVLDPTSGIVPYVGTVSLKGSAIDPNSSGFSIHYLSSLNCSTVTCQPCAPVSIPCSPVTINCGDNPCPPMTPGQIDPCDGCQ